MSAEPKTQEAFDRLAAAVRDYLALQGWKVLVIGSPRVQQQPNDRPLNFEFVLRFTGGKPDGST